VDATAVEQLVARHGGKKSMYSPGTCDEQAFWTMYDRRAYEAPKRTNLLASCDAGDTPACRRARRDLE
jgi:hypothetical protein